MFEFVQEMYFHEKASGNKNNRGNFPIGLLNSSAIMARSLKEKTSSKPKETNIWFLSSNPNEICVRLKSLMKEKTAGSISYKANEKIFAIADDRLEYGSISTKQDSTSVELFHWNNIQPWLNCFSETIFEKMRFFCEIRV